MGGRESHESSHHGPGPQFDDQCKLLQGVFATVLQVFLAFAALSILVLKRFRERPRRPWSIWAMDSGKQVVSSGTSHITNIATAMLIANIIHPRGGGGAVTPGEGSPHECSWYFITFLFDTTLGSLTSYVGIIIMERCARLCRVSKLSHSGDYGNPPKASTFFAQLAVWVLIVVLGRLCNGFIEYGLSKPLDWVAAEIAYPFRDHPKALLISVMVLCPIVLNCFQAWVQDQFLKLGKKGRKKLLKDAKGDAAGADERTGLLAGARVRIDTDDESDQRIERSSSVDVAIASSSHGDGDGDDGIGATPTTASGAVTIAQPKRTLRPTQSVPSFRRHTELVSPVTPTLPPQQQQQQQTIPTKK